MNKVRNLAFILLFLISNTNLYAEKGQKLKEYSKFLLEQDKIFNKFKERFYSLDYKKAKKLINYILSKDRDNLLALDYKALLLYKEKKLKEALKLVNRSLDIDKDFLFSWVIRYTILKDVISPKRKEFIRNKILNSPPEELYDYFSCGFFWELEGEYSKAIKEYDTLLRKYPHHIEALIHKGGCLLRLQEYKEALSCFNEVISQNKNIAIAWNNRGIIFMRFKKYNQAKVSFFKSLKINPLFVESWYNLGISLLSTGNFEDALLCFDTAIELNPKFASAWNNKGSIMYFMGKYKEARLCWQTAYKIAPQSSAGKDALNNLKVLEKVVKSKK